MYVHVRRSACACYVVSDGVRIFARCVVEDFFVSEEREEREGIT